MGSLAIGKMLMQLAGLSLKTARFAGKIAYGTAKAAVNVAPHVSPAVQTVVRRLNHAVTQTRQNAIKRQELRKVYAQKRTEVSAQVEDAAHIPYVVAQTTDLGELLTEKDWQELATDRVSEEELLARVETRFDSELHARVQVAAQEAGYGHPRAQVRSGLVQVANYSDGSGHGVRVAIQHDDDSRIGVDMLGYSGEACQKENQAMLTALARQGIHLTDIRNIDHDDPEGYQGVQVSASEEEQQSLPLPQQQLLQAGAGS